MTLSNKLHLLWRAGFGPTTRDLPSIEKNTIKEIWQSLRGAETKPNLLSLSNSFVQDNYHRFIDPTISKAEKEELNRKMRAQSAQDLKELNQTWMDLMIHSEQQLYEKTCLFWHGHFAIRQPNSFLQLEAINTIRTYALGNFKDLLRAVSKSGAMILSLNNQQNKKSAPNENFAREIMELFSMGMGHYTEQDIKEAARAFTGWSIGRDGKYVFRADHHDKGSKTIFGISGRFTGDDVIDLILQQPQTAEFITKKIYQFFVNEQPDEKRMHTLAEGFRKDYEILPLLEKIFTSEWFYHPKNIGNKLKSPVELIVGIERFSPFGTIGKNVILPAQKLLGQILFYPPSIAGWPMGKGWIDSSTIMVRLQMAKLINGNMGIRLKAKTDDDANMGREVDEVQLHNGKEVKLNSEWMNWASKKTDQEVMNILILSSIAKDKIALLPASTKKEWAIELMSLPEYQLC